MKTIIGVACLLLATQAAVAGDSCAFRPRLNGAIEGYVETRPGEQADGVKLIGQLPENFVANGGKPVVVNSVVLAYEGRGVWALRRAAARDQPPIALVRGPERLAEKWQADYGRSLVRMLGESLHTGKRIQLLAIGECG